MISDGHTNPTKSWELQYRIRLVFHFPRLRISQATIGASAPPPSTPPSTSPPPSTLLYQKETLELKDLVKALLSKKGTKQLQGSDLRRIAVQDLGTEVSSQF